MPGHPDFIVLPKALFLDTRLSLEAKMLYCEMCISIENDKTSKSVSDNPVLVELLNTNWVEKLNGVYYILSSPTHKLDIDDDLALQRIEKRIKQDFTPRQKLLANRDGGYFCAYCKKELTRNTINIDHKLPRSKGGSNHIDNLCLCCRSCNSKKSNRYTYDEFLAIMDGE